MNNIFNFRQNSRWRTKFWKFNFFHRHYKVSSTQRVQTLLKITLSLTVFGINDIFNFRQNSGNSTFFRGTSCDFSSSHWVQNLLKIALFVMVFQINGIFDFRQDSIWRPKFIFRSTTSKISGTQRVQNLLVTGKQFLLNVASS